MNYMCDYELCDYELCDYALYVWLGTICVIMNYMCDYELYVYYELYV